MRFNSCLWFHCRISSAWKRNKILGVMDLHHTSSIFQRPRCHHKKRHKGICTWTALWKPLVVACWDLQWLHHLHTCVYEGWGIGGGAAEQPSLPPTSCAAASQSRAASDCLFSSSTGSYSHRPPTQWGEVCIYFSSCDNSSIDLPAPCLQDTRRLLGWGTHLCPGLTSFGHSSFSKQVNRFSLRFSLLNQTKAISAHTAVQDQGAAQLAWLFSLNDSMTLWFLQH